MPIKEKNPTLEEIRQAKERLRMREYFYTCNTCGFEKVIIVRDPTDKKEAVMNELIKHEEKHGHHITHTMRLSEN